jgi:hypothetical protein
MAARTKLPESDRYTRCSGRVAEANRFDIQLEGKPSREFESHLLRKGPGASWALGGFLGSALLQKRAREATRAAHQCSCSVPCGAQPAKRISVAIELCYEGRRKPNLVSDGVRTASTNSGERAWVDGSHVPELRSLN